MRPCKLKILLLVLGILGTIRFYATKDIVNPPDSIICLQPKEFDFYAQSVVDKNQLKRDTAKLRGITRAQIIVINSKNDQLKGDSVISLAKDDIVNTYKSVLKTQVELSIKQQKKIKILKNLSLVLSSVTVVLAGILLLVL